jgi:hypothetical protein
MKKKLPKDNKLPDSTYEAKKVLCPLGLEVQKIHALMTASSTTVRSTRIWKHAQYTLHCGIRSDEMTLVMLRASPPERGFLPRLCGMLL